MSAKAEAKALSGGGVSELGATLKATARRAWSGRQASATDAGLTTTQPEQGVDADLPGPPASGAAEDQAANRRERGEDINCH